MGAHRSRRDGDGNLRRRPPLREPIPLLLVVCEGEVTEPRYIDTFRAAQGSTAVRVRVLSPGGDPRALVERAIELRDAARLDARRAGDPNLAYDEVWCVFDVDQHARFNSACLLAAEAGIRVALSNPCFELWLFLHFADRTAHLSTVQARRLLKGHLPRYDKHIRFDELEHGYSDAVARAQTLERRHAEQGSPGANPSTGMHHLTERIRQFGKERRLAGR
jgi:hypothetical protein